VIVVGRTLARVARVARSIADSANSAEPIEADATSEDDIKRLFDRAFSRASDRQPPDLIVFHAGSNQPIDFRSLETNDFEDFWRIGSYAGLLVGREAARRKRASIGRASLSNKANRESAHWLFTSTRAPSEPTRDFCVAVSRRSGFDRPC